MEKAGKNLWYLSSHGKIIEINFAPEIHPQNLELIIKCHNLREYCLYTSFPENQQNSPWIELKKWIISENILYLYLLHGVHGVVHYFLNNVLTQMAFFIKCPVSTVLW